VMFLALVVGVARLSAAFAIVTHWIP
jgi:hypothetical protein